MPKAQKWFVFPERATGFCQLDLYASYWEIVYWTT